MNKGNSYRPLTPKVVDIPYDSVPYAETLPEDWSEAYPCVNCPPDYPMDRRNESMYCPPAPEPEPEPETPSYFIVLTGEFLDADLSADAIAAKPNSRPFVTLGLQTKYMSNQLFIDAATHQIKDLAITVQESDDLNGADRYNGEYEYTLVDPTGSIMLYASKHTFRHVDVASLTQTTSYDTPRGYGDGSVDGLHIISGGGHIYRAPYATSPGLAAVVNDIPNYFTTSASEFGSGTLWDPSDGVGYDARISPDGTKYVVVSSPTYVEGEVDIGYELGAGTDDVIKVYDRASQGAVVLLDDSDFEFTNVAGSNLSGVVNGVVFSPDSSQLFIANTYLEDSTATVVSPNAPKIYSATTGALVQTLPLPSTVVSATVPGQSVVDWGGDYIACSYSTDDGDVFIVWRVSTNSVVFEKNIGLVFDVKFSIENDNKLYVSASVFNPDTAVDTGGYYVIDTTTWTETFYPVAESGVVGDIHIGLIPSSVTPQINSLTGTVYITIPT